MDKYIVGFDQKERLELSKNEAVAALILLAEQILMKPLGESLVFTISIEKDGANN
jgi:hypothetical protein